MSEADAGPTVWHTLAAAEVRSRLEAPEDGLTRDEAARRLERYGPNELKQTRRKSVGAMVLDQFRDFMIVVLIVAAVVAGLLGEVTDMVAIVVIVLLNAVLGFVQEYRAERAMAALARMAAPSATVWREGRSRSVAAPELVPGDRVTLAAGDVVPADLRLSEAAQLRIEESALTGESVAADKDAGSVPAEDAPLGDRANMAYKGTTVAHGRADGIVVATGMRTELGRIAELLQRQEAGATPLQRRLAVFGRRLAYLVLVISAAVFVSGLLRGEPMLRMLLTSISLAVAAIPEALPAVVTISLALGARKLVRQMALVRRLPAVETLGSVTYICTDKTGTLTEGRMSVRQLVADGRSYGVDELPEVTPPAVALDLDLDTLRTSPLSTSVIVMALCNDARLHEGGPATGDPTEVALARFAAERGFERDSLEREAPRLAEVPFDAQRKRMTTFHRLVDGTVVSFTKGAVEGLVGRCAEVPCDVGASAERLAAEGLRTLGFAMHVWDEVPSDLAADRVERDLGFVGMVGMIDPPRLEAADSVAECITAGVLPVMITGDHPRTAEAIARQVGILDHDGRAVMTGVELARLSAEELAQRVEEVRVYARVAPEQKLRIVEALQDRGQFVAMTGDGVNDAPALKRADIGVAMGIAGTDVSKEASDLILLDDDFSTIVGAVREGRRIFDNIRKFVKYTMTSNLGEIVAIAAAPFFGLPIPLLPVHILWINLVTDGVPGLALTAEPGEKDLMRRPPRHPKESIFARGLGLHIAWVGVTMGAVAIATQWLFFGADEGTWRTITFTVLALSQMGHVLAVRSERASLFRQGLFSNKAVLGAVILTLVLQLGTIYLPQLRPFFGTVPLTPAQLAVALALSSVVFTVVELEKLVKRLRIPA